VAHAADPAVAVVAVSPFTNPPSVAVSAGLAPPYGRDELCAVTVSGRRPTVSVPLTKVNV